VKLNQPILAGNVMPFNIAEFQNQKIIHRTGEVAVERLAKYFPEGEKPVWKVRGLSGEEMARVGDDVSSNANIGTPKDNPLGNELADVIKRITGKGENVPDSHVHKMAMVEYGSVDPKVSRQDVVKLAAVSVIDFLAIFTKIAELTTMGTVTEEKLKPSTETTESGTP